MNQFGFFVGGPLIHRHNPKTFFFVDYEGNRVRQAQTYISSVPKAAFRTGDFSTYSRKIYDPLTQRSNGSGGFIRDQFPNNIIPANRLDTVGRNLLTSIRCRISDPARRITSC